MVSTGATRERLRTRFSWISKACAATRSAPSSNRKGLRRPPTTGCNACACDVAALAKGSRFHKFTQRQGTCLSGSESQKENSMKHVAALALALGMAWASNGARAQDAWPSRAITFIVPYGPGGYTDLVGRLTARYVEKALGKPVIVESRVGAGGIVGTQYVASAAPDGYTFCVCSVGAVSIAPFAQKLGYDPVQDLAPVGIVSTIVQAIIVKKDLPVKSMAELVAYAKASPGKLNFGSSGAGGLTHYSVELFQARTGTEMVHIPFKGGAPAMAAVLSGDVDLSFANMTDALPQIEADTVRGLAVTSRERSPYLPNLPSIHETVAPD